MSNRLTTVRDALQQLLVAAEAAFADRHRLSAATGEALNVGILDAIRALRATAFVAPYAFPVEVEARDGVRIILVARHGDQLIGLRPEDGGLDAATWNLDGSYFGADDPWPQDLVLPEVNPATVSVAP